MADDLAQRYVFTGYISPSYAQVLVGKFAPDGELLWTSVSDPAPESRHGDGVAVSPDDSIVVAGEVPFTSDALAGRFTGGGQQIWFNDDFSGTRMRAVASDGAGNLIFVGQTLDAVLTIKTDATGKILWSRSEALPNASSELGEGVGVDPNGFIMIAAYTSVGPFVAKYAP